MPIDLNWFGSIPVMEVMQTIDPNTIPYAYIFNWFFSTIIFFGVIGLLMGMAFRVINRS